MPERVAVQTLIPQSAYTAKREESARRRESMRGERAALLSVPPPRTLGRICSHLTLAAEDDMLLAHA